MRNPRPQRSELEAEQGVQPGLPTPAQPLAFPGLKPGVTWPKALPDPGAAGTGSGPPPCFHHTGEENSGSPSACVKRGALVSAQRTQLSHLHHRRWPAAPACLTPQSHMGTGAAQTQETHVPWPQPPPSLYSHSHHEQG